MTIAKGRFRSGLPGRPTQAIAQAMINSLAGVAEDQRKIMGQAQPGVGLQNHLLRMNNLDVKTLDAKANRLGFLDVTFARPSVPSLINDVAATRVAGIPTITVVPIAQARPVAVSSVAALAPVGSVTVATIATIAPTGRKRGKKTEVATAAPVGVVIPAVAVIDFDAFVRTYLQHKSHSKAVTMIEYLRKQFASGMKWSITAHLFVKG